MIPYVLLIGIIQVLSSSLCIYVAVIVEDGDADDPDSKRYVECWLKHLIHENDF